ncbi:hybrid sensor histidine kinase/response regulator [bacterium]|nr:hybrid sensor histidine kinase/response regulator [bacterium]
MENSNPKILVVEDDFQNRQLINIYLSRSGYDTILAINGRDALDKLKTFTPDIIVSDISMPHMNGFELYDQVKNIPQLRSIPFIFLTAHSDIEKRRYGKEIGSDDYLTKPIEREDLIASIKGKLKRVHEIRSTTEAQMLQQVDELKRNILSVITHEVNTPLFIIKMTANLLLDDTLQFNPNELQELLLRIKRSGERLDSLLKDFLVSARIAMGEAKKEFDEAKQETDINFIVTHLQHKFRKVTDANNLTLESDFASNLPVLLLHVDQMADVVERLFHNAVKFNRENGAIGMRTKYAEGKVIFEIEDSGIGIPAKEIEKIFDKFYQVNRAEMEQQGAGLGLTIARDIARINGGDIVVESKEGVGSVFRLIFPA